MRWIEIVNEDTALQQQIKTAKKQQLKDRQRLINKKAKEKKEKEERLADIAKKEEEARNKI
jgi:hypothetical protein